MLWIKDHVQARNAPVDVQQARNLSLIHVTLSDVRELVKRWATDGIGVFSEANQKSFIKQVTILSRWKLDHVILINRSTTGE